MQDFINKLGELTELHDKAVKTIALAEAYNPKRKAYLGLYNELRNALFHVMEMIKTRGDEAKYDNEFRAAKSHFKRAGTDACELLCLNCIEYISDLLRQYDEDILIAVPGYYTEIRPKAIEIKQNIAEIKLNKDSAKEDTFENLFNQAEKLIGYVKCIDEYVPDIIEIQKKRRKGKRNERLFQIVMAIAIALGFFVLGRYLS